MKDPYFNFLKSQFGISEEAYLAVRDLTTIRVLKKKEKLVEQDTKSTTLSFLSSGLLRAYLVLESGKEITKNIYNGYNFVGPFSSVLKNENSLLTFEALTDAVLYEVDFNGFIKKTKTNIELSNIYNRILESVFIIYENKYLDQIALNATERFALLKEQIPNIESLIPQYQIASYLNITAVQFSRLKKDLPR